MILSAMSLAFRLPALVGGWAALAIAVLGAAVAAVLVWRAATKGRSTAAVAVSLADSDGDGASDGLEILAGTDPYDGANYCFNASARFEEVYDTNGVITAEVLWGTNSQVRPFALANRNETVDLGHLVVSNRERLTVRCWNSYRTNTEYEVRHGHEYCMTNRLVLSRFDGDSDGIPDYWEVAHGLSPTHPHDALEDGDGDGLVNLHEFWADCKPDIYDGTNTAIYAAIHGVDDRISNTVAAVARPYFDRYHDTAALYRTNMQNAVFSVNTNCWMRGVDLSCLSLICSHESYFDSFPVTLISRRHVIGAAHAMAGTNTQFVFRALDGSVYVRRLERRTSIEGIADDDWCIGILDAPLPTNIAPARLVGPDYRRYIGTGVRLPMIRIGKDKTCSMHDIEYISPNSKKMRMIKVMVPVLAMRRQYMRQPIGMDSGHPIFLLFGNELALICPTRGYYDDEGIASGYCCSDYLTLVQEAMDALSDGSGSARELLYVWNFGKYDCLDNAGGLP